MNSALAAISKEDVQAFYEDFLRALKPGDMTSLERIYSDDYLREQQFPSTHVRETRVN